MLTNSIATLSLGGLRLCNVHELNPITKSSRHGPPSMCISLHKHTPQARTCDTGKPTTGLRNLSNVIKYADRSQRYPWWGVQSSPVHEYYGISQFCDIVHLKCLMGQRAKVCTSIFPDRVDGYTRVARVVISPMSVGQEPNNCTCRYHFTCANWGNRVLYHQLSTSWSSNSPLSGLHSSGGGVCWTRVARNGQDLEVAMSTKADEPANQEYETLKLYTNVINSWCVARWWFYYLYRSAFVHQRS